MFGDFKQSQSPRSPTAASHAKCMNDQGRHEPLSGVQQGCSPTRGLIHFMSSRVSGRLVDSSIPPLSSLPKTCHAGAHSSVCSLSIWQYVGSSDRAQGPGRETTDHRQRLEFFLPRLLIFPDSAAFSLGERPPGWTARGWILYRSLCLYLCSPGPLSPGI